MQEEHQQIVTLNNQDYPVTISGTGSKDLLIIGLGTLMHRTLSDEFRQYFKVFSTDLYWAQEHHDTQPSLDHLAQDVILLCQLLNLNQPYIMAHSAYGPLALHAAKLFPSAFTGIIMSGSPPGWNPMLIAKNEADFQTHADPSRKALDAKHRASMSQDDMNGLNPYQRFLTTYCDLDRARYWYNPNYDARPLWKGLTVNMPIFTHYFDTLLPAYRITDNMNKVTCAVFLAAGLYDYDCCPKSRWLELKQLPRHFTLADFLQSGHYPHFEEPTEFLKKLLAWSDLHTK